jgi:hypothetical protein
MYTFRELERSYPTALYTFVVCRRYLLDALRIRSSTSHAVGALDQLAFTWFLRAGSFCDSESIINSESSSHGTRWYAEEDRALSWSITFAYCTKDEIDCSENLRAWPWPCHLCTRAPRRSIVNGWASNDNDEHVSHMLVVSSRHALDHAFSALHHVRIKRRKLA